MRNLLITLALITTAVILTPSVGRAQATETVPDQNQQAVHLVGHYAVEGENPNGSDYAGTAEIVAVGDTYEVIWSLGPNGQESYRGVGLLNGELLSVAYGGSHAGIVTYEIQHDGRLIGRWAILGRDGRVFTETLSPIVDPQ